MFDSMRVNNRITPNSRRRLKRREDDESKRQNKVEKESESTNNSNLSRSKGLQYVENLQNGSPQRTANQPYSNMYGYNPQIHTSSKIQNPQNRLNGVQPNVSRPVSNAYAGSSNINQNNNQAVTNPQNTITVNGSTIIKSPKINIAQVLGDFKNTANAIGTPEEIMDEVNTYLGLVEKQTKKGNANVNVVQTNLNNAAIVLDKYISDTLNKESKVVENWIEAIFLQQVDYNYNENDINEAFLVKMPEDKKKEEASQTSTATQPEPQTIPEKPENKQIDGMLKQLFIAGKNAVKANNNQAALEIFAKAITRSQEVQDTETQAKLHYETGVVYDKTDDLPKALENYNKAIEKTSDNNVKARAHYSMAQIYDDVKQFKPAIEHYMAAVSFAGESDNLKAQTQSLTKIGNIYTDKYDKEAFKIYEDAEIVANETKDFKVKGYVSSTIANAHNKFNNPTEALHYYSNAAKNYYHAGENEKVAITYKHAGELMQDYNKIEKGNNLIKKAILYAQKANNKKLASELYTEMSMHTN